MSQSAPEFSFVATSRNDDHGGDVLRRTQSFINRLAEQCERHQVKCELVLVDWNPPPTRAPLADVLSWPGGNPWFAARVITVPPSLHWELRHSSRLVMFQMIAKNVGIRRARGAYIIATNIDIIFSDELFKWLKSGVMRPGILYRSDRWDIPNEIQLEADLNVLLERARREAMRHNLKDGTYVLRDGAYVNMSENRFDRLFYDDIHKRVTGLKSAIDDEADFSRDKIGRLASDLVAALPQRRREFLLPQLHTNGCGDFTMLAQRDWSMLCGYPEWNLFSWHIDSVLIYQAYYAGLAVEEIGGTCVHYHIEHDSGWTPGGAGSLWDRLAERGVPYISDQHFQQIVAEMRDASEQGEVKIYNRDDWGFAGYEFDVCDIVKSNSAPRKPVATNVAPLREHIGPNRAPIECGDILSLAQATNGVRFEHQIGRDGTPEIVVETLADTWSFALEFERSCFPISGEHWIRVQVVIDRGNVGFGICTRSNDALLAEAAAGGPRPDVQILLVHVPEIGDAGNVVLRNLTTGNQSACFRLVGMELMRDIGVVALDSDSNEWDRNSERAGQRPRVHRSDG